jgi:hypothetical protein
MKSGRFRGKNVINPGKKEAGDNGVSPKWGVCVVS